MPENYVTAIGPEGGEVTGWLEPNKGQLDMVINSKFTEAAGVTILHEASHLLRLRKGRPLTTDEGKPLSVAEASAEKLAQFVARGERPIATSKKKVRAAIRKEVTAEAIRPELEKKIIDRASQRAWEQRVSKGDRTEVAVDKLDKIGAGARSVIDRLMALTKKRPEKLIFFQEKAHRSVAGLGAKLYGPKRKGTLVGLTEVKPESGRTKKVWTVLDVSAPTMAERVKLFETLAERAQKVRKPLYLSTRMESTELFKELQGRGYVSSERVGKLYKSRYIEKKAAEAKVKEKPVVAPTDIREGDMVDFQAPKHKKPHRGVVQAIEVDEGGNPTFYQIRQGKKKGTAGEMFRMPADQVSITAQAQSMREFHADLATVPKEKRPQVKQDATEFKQLVRDNLPEFVFGTKLNEIFERVATKGGEGRQALAMSEALAEAYIRAEALLGVKNLEKPTARAVALPKLKEYLAPGKKPSVPPEGGGGGGFMPFRRQVKAAEKEPLRMAGSLRKVVVRLVERISPEAGEFVQKATDTFQPSFIMQLLNTIGIPKAKKAADWAVRADNDWHVELGRWTERSLDAGLRGRGDKLVESRKKRAENEAWGKALSDAIETGNAPEFNRLFENMIDWVNEFRVKNGMKPIPQVKNYLPRRAQREIAEKVYDDFRWISDELATLKKHLEADKKAGIKRNVNQEMDRAVLSRLQRSSEKTRELVRFVTDPQTGQVKSASQAIQRLKIDFANELVIGPSFIHERRLKYPSSFYERDARILIPQYITEVTKWMAEQKNFGPGMGKLESVLRDLRRTPVGFKDAERLKKLVAMWSGRYELDYGLKGKVKTISDAYTALQVGAKIGLGGATILNLAQPLISFVPEVGVWNSVRGALSLLDPAVRKEIRGSGATLHYAIQAVAGHQPGGLLGAFAELTTKVSGFHGVNKGLLYLSAATIRQGIGSWHRAARRSGARGTWAKKRLADFDIDPNRPLSAQKDKIDRAMYRFATDSQLQKNIMAEPAMFNEPWARPLFLFKRFGYRQATYIKDMLWREVVERGNFAPVLRLAVGGYLGGTGVTWALNSIKSGLSGEPYYRRDDSFAEELLSDLATIGAFGVISDIGNVDKISRLPDAVRFAISPVMVSDIDTFLKAWAKFSGDWERYGDGWLATKRNLNTLFNPLGTYPRAFSKRLMGDQQTINRLEYRKNKEKTDIFKLLVEGNDAGASRRVAAWNKVAQGDMQFDPSEFTIGKIMKWIDRRAASIAAAQAKEGTPLYRRIRREQRAELRAQFKQELRGR
jgi:hypothetical protein